MPMDKNFDAATAEPRITALWDAAGAFNAGAGARRSETFCIMIPPPNVTGSLHMGHAFNNTLQDILTRWHRMRGFDTLWQPGTDHAGIATQMVVERELAKTNRRRTDFTREEFLKLVWQQKQKSRGNIKAQLQRLGASCDWSREAFTMTGAPGDPDHTGPNFHDAVIKVFVDLYNKGLIYRGKRLVNWDPHFETAISDLEVENTEVPGHMWHFKYPLAGGETYEYVEKDAEGNVAFREVRDYISIATTRPETMLGDGAVAVHPSDERYAPIVGKLCEIPVGPKEHRRLIPIITDEYPDPNFGSGAVKITGAHDFNDYAVAKRNTIPCYRLMDTKAALRTDGAPYAEAAAAAQRLREGAPFTDAEVDAINLVPDEYRGLDRFAARKRVVEAITAEGLAVMVPDAEGNPVPFVDSKKIMQPFGDRSKVVIEPMLTDQWFVDTAKIVQPAIDAVRNGDTVILPERDTKTYFHWLENIEPWCISRQLWWGHQIPVWYAFAPDKVDGLVELSRKYQDHIQLFAAGEDVEFNDSVSNYTTFTTIQVCAESQAVAEQLIRTQLPYEANLVFGDGFASLGRERFDSMIAVGLPKSEDDPVTVFVQRDPDVLDTWFSSGLWPIGTLGWPEDTPELKRYFPTSTLVTGFDIIFFWVARMMMMQLAVVGEVPFKTVYVHALVRDEKGKKMSKSLGNVLDPLDLIDEYGADAVRFTLTAMAAMGRDLKLSTQRITGYRNFTTKLWNACRFAELNGVWENHATQAKPPQPKATVNRWILGEAAKVRAEVDEALTAYRFDQAADALYKFVWGKVCDWYVEFAKPLFDGAQAQETRATMAFILDQCMTLLHPMMPFVTEELWQTTGKRETVLALRRWPDYGADLIDADADREMNWVIDLIDSIRSARTQVRVPVGLKLDMLCLALDATGRAAWDRNATLIQRLARIETLTDADAAPKGAITIPVEGGLFALPLAGVIDIAEERARLAKTLEKLEKDMNGLRGRLSNPQFLASAKEEVIDEARTKLEAGEEEAAKLHAALARLNELA